MFLPEVGSVWFVFRIGGGGGGNGGTMFVISEDDSGDVDARDTTGIIGWLYWCWLGDLLSKLWITKK